MSALASDTVAEDTKPDIKGSSESFAAQWLGARTSHRQAFDNSQMSRRPTSNLSSQPARRNVLPL